MNYCKCGCGMKVEKVYKRGHARRGVECSLEHKQKLSISHKGKLTGKPAWNYGKSGLYHHSEETKEKISKIAKDHGFGKWMNGRKLPKETVDKMIKSKVGFMHSEGTKEKISHANSSENNGMYGKTHSPEARKRISEAVKLRWKNKEFRDHMNTINTSDVMRERGAKAILPLQDSTIELKIQTFLTQLSITFEKHKRIENISHKYRCDIYIPEKNMIIECDGDYWHNYPDGRSIDKIRTDELKERGYNVVRLWENEIRTITIDDFKRRINYV